MLRIFIICTTILVGAIINYDSKFCVALCSISFAVIAIIMLFSENIKENDYVKKALKNSVICHIITALGLGAGVGGIVWVLCESIHETCPIMWALWNVFFAALCYSIICLQCKLHKKYKNTFSHIFFFCVLIAFSICYKEIQEIYNRYEANIEVTQETRIEKREEFELLAFYGIPIRNISGEESGNKEMFTDNISGEIFTFSKLEYWYLNQDGEGLYNVAPSIESKIKFIEEGEIPYITITTYYNVDIKNNKNTGKITECVATCEGTGEEIRWTKWVFYVPKSIFNYMPENLIKN